MDEFDIEEDNYERVNKLCEQHNDTFKNSIWSVYEINDFNDIAFEGENLTLFYKNHWGTPVYEDLPTNPTWLDMWKYGDYLISISGDNHHIFIEDFKRSNNTIYMYTGS